MLRNFIFLEHISTISRSSTDLVFDEGIRNLLVLNIEVFLLYEIKYS